MDIADREALYDRMKAPALIAVDNNILVYAHREEFPEHRSALSELTRLAEGPPPGPFPSS